MEEDGEWRISEQILPHGWDRQRRLMGSAQERMGKGLARRWGWGPGRGEKDLDWKSLGKLLTGTLKAHGSRQRQLPQHSRCPSHCLQGRQPPSCTGRCTRTHAHTHRHTGACQILVFLIYHGQPFSSKQRPFVLPLPDQGDHWEAEEGGWQAH